MQSSAFSLQDMINLSDVDKSNPSLSRVTSVLNVKHFWIQGISARKPVTKHVFS